MKHHESEQPSLGELYNQVQAGHKTAHGIVNTVDLEISQKEVNQEAVKELRRLKEQGLLVSFSHEELDDLEEKVTTQPEKPIRQEVEIPVEKEVIEYNSLGDISQKSLENRIRRLQTNKDRLQNWAGTFGRARYSAPAVMTAINILNLPANSSTEELIAKTIAESIIIIVGYSGLKKLLEHKAQNATNKITKYESRLSSNNNLRSPDNIIKM